MRLLLLCLVSTLSGCALAHLKEVDVTAAARERASASLAHPNLQPATIDEWLTALAPELRVAFQDHVYGKFPTRTQTDVLGRQTLVADDVPENAIAETILVRVTTWFEDGFWDTEVFSIDLVLPQQSAGPSPILLMQTFCPRTGSAVRPAASGGGPGVSCSGGLSTWLMRRLFGREIARPPLESLLERGVGVAALYSPGLVPDHPRAGIDVLNASVQHGAPAEARWGAIGAWAWLYSRMFDALEDDTRVDHRRVFTFGHSRFGKAALVAAAFDPRIAGVVSNQSGLGGASLTKNGLGESVAQISRKYPHWFAARFAAYAGREELLPLDQHLLLALVAPRPVFLGNALRDGWSDPIGAFDAASAATQIYHLWGANGLTSAHPLDFHPDSELSFWLRDGLHGVRDDDWFAILRFLDAHLAARDSF